jgi:hypothetical protein
MKDQDEMTLNSGVDDWVWQGLNCMNLKVWKTIKCAIKSNWKNND